MRSAINIFFRKTDVSNGFVFCATLSCFYANFRWLIFHTGTDVSPRQRSDQFRGVLQLLTYSNNRLQLQVDATIESVNRQVEGWKLSWKLRSKLKQKSACRVFVQLLPSTFAGWSNNWKCKQASWKLNESNVMVSILFILLLT